MDFSGISSVEFSMSEHSLKFGLYLPSTLRCFRIVCVIDCCCLAVGECRGASGIGGWGLGGILPD
jgi:hypothetical protein